MSAVKIGDTVSAPSGGGLIRGVVFRVHAFATFSGGLLLQRGRIPQWSCVVEGGPIAYCFDDDGIPFVVAVGWGPPRHASSIRRGIVVPE